MIEGLHELSYIPPGSYLHVLTQSTGTSGPADRSFGCACSTALILDTRY